MNDYLSTITPDSFSGIIFGLEGISDSLVILNGPTGCKYYHSATSDNQMIRQLALDPLNYQNNWYFGQPRVPCTYLDNGDYVYGSEDKLRELLENVRDTLPFELVSIVNSPGASLIGDDIEGIARSVFGDSKKFVTIETPGFSSDVPHGHETAMTELLEQVPPEHGLPVVPGRVNLLGLSLHQRNIMGDVRELCRMVELCGGEVGCVLCAGCSVSDIEAIGSAELNVVVYPEYALETARFLEREYGTPYVVACPPIGFGASERFIRDVCSMLTAPEGGKIDPKPALDDVKRARARAYAFISRVNSTSGLPKGVPYAVEGVCSELRSYVEFLTGYMGMLPASVQVLDVQSNVWIDELRALLERYGVSDAMDVPIDESEADIVLGTGNTIAALRLQDEEFCGIETALPSIGYYDVVPKTFMGPNGTLHLVEMVLNALPF